MYIYELAWKGESKIEIPPHEADEIQDILLTRDNLTYTEIQNLDNDVVETIYQVNSFYAKGQKMKQKTDEAKAKSKTSNKSKTRR